MSACYERTVQWLKGPMTSPMSTLEDETRLSAACEIPFTLLRDPLAAAGFAISTNAVGFKPMVYFDRTVSDGLHLHVLRRTDSHTNPQCITRVRVEMKPSDD